MDDCSAQVQTHLCGQTHGYGVFSEVADLSSLNAGVAFVSDDVAYDTCNFEDFDDMIRTGCDIVSSDSESDDDEAGHIDNTRHIRYKLAEWATKFSITLSLSRCFTVHLKGRTA
jgi:hypothetical protein